MDQKIHYKLKNTAWLDNILLCQVIFQHRRGYGMTNPKVGGQFLDANDRQSKKENQHSSFKPRISFSYHVKREVWEQLSPWILLLWQTLIVSQIKKNGFFFIVHKIILSSILPLPSPRKRRCFSLRRRCPSGQDFDFHLMAFRFMSWNK